MVMPACAGSRFGGAGILSCRSALVSGCGLVTGWCRKISIRGFSASPAALIRPRPVDTHDLILDFKEQCMIREAVLIGPGCGVNQETGLLLEQSLRHAQRVVVDADALTVLADSEDLQAELSARTVRKLEPAILTPHPGEVSPLYPEARVFRGSTRRLGLAIAGTPDQVKGAGQSLDSEYSGRAFNLIIPLVITDFYRGSGMLAGLMMDSGQYYLTEAVRSGLSAGPAGDLSGVVVPGDGYRQPVDYTAWHFESRLGGRS